MPNFKKILGGGAALGATGLGGYAYGGSRGLEMGRKKGLQKGYQMGRRDAMLRHQSAPSPQPQLQTPQQPDQADVSSPDESQADAEETDKQEKDASNRFLKSAGKTPAPTQTDEENRFLKSAKPHVPPKKEEGQIAFSDSGAHLVGLPTGGMLGPSINTARDERSKSIGRSMGDAGSRFGWTLLGNAGGAAGGAAAGAAGGAGAGALVGGREGAGRMALPAAGIGAVGGGLYGMYQGAQTGREHVDQKYNEEGEVKPDEVILGEDNQGHVAGESEKEANLPLLAQSAIHGPRPNIQMPSAPQGDRARMIMMRVPRRGVNRAQPQEQQEGLPHEMQQEERSEQNSETGKNEREQEDGSGENPEPPQSEGSSSENSSGEAPEENEEESENESDDQPDEEKPEEEKTKEESDEESKEDGSDEESDGEVPKQLQEGEEKEAGNKCPHCGAEITDEGKCPKCGEDVSKEAEFVPAGTHDGLAYDWVQKHADVEKYARYDIMEGRDGVYITKRNGEKLHQNPIESREKAEQILKQVDASKTPVLSGAAGGAAIGGLGSAALGGGPAPGAIGGGALGLIRGKIKKHQDRSKVRGRAQQAAKQASEEDCGCDEKTADEDSEGGDPCWDGYVQAGMKTKNGKKVPNCIPKESHLQKKLAGTYAMAFDEAGEQSVPNYIAVDPNQNTEEKIASALERDLIDEEDATELFAMKEAFDQDLEKEAVGMPSSKAAQALMAAGLLAPPAMMAAGKAIDPIRERIRYERMKRLPGQQIQLGDQIGRGRDNAREEWNVPEDASKEEATEKARRRAFGILHDQAPEVTRSPSVARGLIRKQLQGGTPKKLMVDAQDLGGNAAQSKKTRQETQQSQARAVSDAARAMQEAPTG